MKMTLLCMTLTVVLALTGCFSKSLGRHEAVFDRYHSTTLKSSTSSDVLAMIQDPENELLSQSESVIAAWGKEGAKDRTHWFNMVAFDEELRGTLKKAGYLTRDSRMVERKKYGLRGARRRFQYSKR